MKYVVTFALLAVLFVSSALPTIATILEMPDSLASGVVIGANGIGRPHLEQAQDTLDLSNYLASGVIIGTIRRPRR